MRSWFTIRERCERCGLRFERGQDEEHDYWFGAYTLNFIATEIVFAVALLHLDDTGQTLANAVTGGAPATLGDTEN